MRTLLANLGAACLWMLVQQRMSVPAFLAGWAIGFLILLLHRDLLGSDDYVRRTAAFLWFVPALAWELVRATWGVARLVLTRSVHRMAPDFITYDVSDLQPHESLLLSYCITLTPGTTVAREENDRRTLVLHAIEAGDPESVRTHITTRLKEPLLAFLR